MLIQLSNSFLDERQIDLTGQKREWRQRYFTAIEIIQANGIKTAEDIEAGADSYVLIRSEWHNIVVAMAEYMDYGWREIAPREQ